MNFCKNCKHYTKDHSHMAYDRCKKYIIRADPVTGNTIYRSCHESRFGDLYCGYGGSQFDPKPTLTQRVAQFFKPAPTTK